MLGVRERLAHEAVQVIKREEMHICRHGVSMRDANEATRELMSVLDLHTKRKGLSDPDG